MRPGRFSCSTYLRLTEIEFQAAPERVEYCSLTLSLGKLLGLDGWVKKTVARTRRGLVLNEWYA